jgi:hypothetical protein
MSEIFGFDAYSPKEIAERVETIGITKARLPLVSQLTLGILAGGFIGLGALYFTLVTSDASLSFATGRILGGLAFSLGHLGRGCRRGAFHRQQFAGHGLGRPAHHDDGIAAQLVGYLSGEFYRRAGLGFVSALVAAMAHEQRRGGHHRGQDRRRQSCAAVLGSVFQRRSLQHSGLPGRLARSGRAQCSG